MALPFAVISDTKGNASSCSFISAFVLPQVVFALRFGGTLAFGAGTGFDTRGVGAAELTAALHPARVRGARGPFGDGLKPYLFVVGAALGEATLDAGVSLREFVRLSD